MTRGGYECPVDIMKSLRCSIQYFVKLLSFIIIVAVLSLILKHPENRISLSDTNTDDNNDNGASCNFPLPSRSPWYEWKAMDRNSKTFVLSAFLEASESEQSVLIFGITTKYVDHFCRIWSSDLKTQKLVVAEAKIHADSHLRKYQSLTYECAASDVPSPGFVSIVESKCQPPSYFLVIQNARHPNAENHVTIKTSNGRNKINFTVCLSPLNNNYGSYSQLIEWIEVNRLFGAERFLVYNHTSSSEVGKVLKFYHDEGIVEIVPWRIPVRVTSDSNGEEEVHYYAQTVALNDCVHRSKNFSRFVINVDVDEIIIPRIDSNYFDLIHRAYTLHSTKSSKDATQTHYSSMDSCGFIVRNTFFRFDKSQDFFSKQHSNPAINALKEDIFRHDARTLWITTREREVFPPGHRSKLIVGTSRPDWLGIHHPNFKKPVVVIKKEMGLLHHYRNIYWDDHSKKKEIIDDYMHRFAPDIMSRLRQVYEKVKIPPLRLDTPKVQLLSFFPPLTQHST